MWAWGRARGVRLWDLALRDLRSCDTRSGGMSLMPQLTHPTSRCVEQTFSAKPCIVVFLSPDAFRFKLLSFGVVWNTEVGIGTPFPALPPRGNHTSHFCFWHLLVATDACQKNFVFRDLLIVYFVEFVLWEVNTAKLNFYFNQSILFVFKAKRTIRLMVEELYIAAFLPTLDFCSSVDRF